MKKATFVDLYRNMSGFLTDGSIPQIPSNKTDRNDTVITFKEDIVYEYFGDAG